MQDSAAVDALPTDDVSDCSMPMTGDADTTASLSRMMLQNGFRSALLTARSSIGAAASSAMEGCLTARTPAAVAAAASTTVLRCCRAAAARGGGPPRGPPRSSCDTIAAGAAGCSGGSSDCSSGWSNVDSMDGEGAACSGRGAAVIADAGTAGGVGGAAVAAAAAEAAAQMGACRIYVPDEGACRVAAPVGNCRNASASMHGDSTAGLGEYTSDGEGWFLGPAALPAGVNSRLMQRNESR